MKRMIYACLLFMLASLLTACPGAQTPIADVAGTWTGFAGDLSSETRRTPITAELVQAGTTLSGTGYFGPALPGSDSSGPITGRVDASTVVFAFSFLASSEGDTATYEFTGVVSGDAIEGTFAAGINEAPLEPQEGTFRLERP